MTLRLAIDCMGGDHGLSVTVPAALAFLLHTPEVGLILVGQIEPLEAELARQPAFDRSRVELRHASEVVAMDEPPASALRGKRQSSMRLAIEAVKSGDAQACVSAGNTGALMAISRFVLKMLDGIDRPAIAAPIPNQKGGVTTMLDLGANVDCEPQHYLQFAYMGVALATAIEGNTSPTVGLLNIGEEVIKGNDTVKQAAELLRASSLDFRGNVEGNDIFEGTTDVVVCDGFVGNVALKTSEGLARMIGGFIRDEYSRTWLTKLAGLVSLPVLNRIKHRLDHRRYNGASLVGLRGIVIKSHGSADSLAFEQALRRAHEAARNGLLERIAQAVPRLSAETVKAGT
ncbi:MAG: phosphate acyltransferase PlsX [Burkholderiaceae bacterium]|nr:phosphate acyltransferase PlsX [Burkholderiaceae bacterium]